MKLVLAGMLALGTVAFAAPASAQLVNGLSGLNYNGEAPIGTKGGGSPSSLQAPGEAAAMAGALRNEREAGHLQPSLMQAKMTGTGKRDMARVIPRARVLARDDEAQRLRTGAE